MKIIATIFLLISCLPTQAQDYYFINAKSGLNVRSAASLSAQKIAKIPYGVLVEKIADTDIVLTIKDEGKQISGKWVKIKYNNYQYLISAATENIEGEGYVFDGYLKKRQTVPLVNITKIEKERYNALKATTKPVQKAKKVGDLDAIKTILKGRVEWATVDENGDKRADLLQSIRIKNGQKLIINPQTNDFGFAEGWSGYYPAYDILVLEGGHASDRCFSIKTGETTETIGNPEYIIPSPKNSYRLNGHFGGQECVTYFFQKKEGSEFTFLTDFYQDDICTFKEFHWLDETQFIYSEKNYNLDARDGALEYFIGAIKETPFKQAIDDWPVDKLIVECPTDLREVLKRDLTYTKSQWKDVENPLIAYYRGNDFGDYFHLNFEDANGVHYDFGFGNNDYGTYKLFEDHDHFDDNSEYLNKQFKVYWEWKVASFPCCSGGYEAVKAYLPSIVGLELVD